MPLSIASPIGRARISRALLFIAFISLAILAGRACALIHARQGIVAPLLQFPAASEQAAQSRERIAFLETRLQRDRGRFGDLLESRRTLFAATSRNGLSRRPRARAAGRRERRLVIVPDVRNVDGLTSLALAEFASHDFGSARDHARRLTQLDESSAPYAILGDALAELGDYRNAERAYAQMRSRSSHAVDENVATRSARLAQLHGDNAGAERGFDDAS